MAGEPGESVVAPRLGVMCAIRRIVAGRLPAAPSSRRVRRAQSGNIKDYLTFALVGGLFVIAAFCLFLTWPDLYHRLFGGK